MYLSYHTCQAVLVLRGVIIGNRERKDNLFRWYEVVLNLPGEPGYQPNRPWVYKTIEGWCVVVYILLSTEDGIPTGPLSEDFSGI